MRQKKIWVLAAAVLLLAALFGACASKEEAIWTITVDGADKAEFTSLDYAKLDEVSIDTVLTKKDGSEKEETWEGVLLKDVLEYIGAGEYTSVTMEASDGYAKDYTPEIANDSMTILGTKADGDALTEEDGYVKAVAGSQTGNMWIKMLSKITVKNK